MAIRDVYSIKYYSKEGLAERKLEIKEEDLQETIEKSLRSNADFDFDEVEIVNNRPMNIWLECCGHLSAFHIDGRDYDVAVEDGADATSRWVDHPLYYCKKCAKNMENDEDVYLLKVTNSPRMGVCAYDGEQDHYGVEILTR